ncbi:unnamed protein product [Cuscuta europaea]|uniref:Uncharacterized protein n=1 Tax=Cuscuta europaea TaxID=41803 RepID=A0A9P0YJK7_CUSEU|nr:unnamed protein product [Cuscuta europaea]
MAGVSIPYPQQTTPMAPVIGPEFVAPYGVDLAFVRKVRILFQQEKFEVLGVDGNVIFKIKSNLFLNRDRILLLDAADNPVATLQQNLFSLHSRWKVFRGKSTDPKDLLFRLKKSSLFGFKTKLNIYLAANTKEEVCNFYMDGSWSRKSCMVHAHGGGGGGESSAIIAQMHKKHTTGSTAAGKVNFWMTVYPNVDYAFIVSLVVILEDIHRQRSNQQMANQQMGNI